MRTGPTAVPLLLSCLLWSGCATTPLADRLAWIPAGEPGLTPWGPKLAESHEAYLAAENEYKTLDPASRATTIEPIIESWRENLNNDCNYGQKLRPELARLLGRDAATTLAGFLVYTPPQRMYDCAHAYKAMLEVLGSMGPDAEAAIPVLMKGASLIDMPGYAAATFRAMSASVLSGLGDLAVPVVTKALDDGLAAGWPPPSPNWGWEVNQKGNYGVMFVPSEETLLGILNAIGTPMARDAKKRYEARAASQRERESKQTAQTEKEAFETHLAAAQRGDIKSQNAIGVMYYQGNTAVKADRTKAFSWFKKAAQKGDENALRSLCVLLAFEISEKLAVGNNDVFCVRHSAPDDVFPRGFIGRASSKQEPLLVYVDRGWALSGMYSQMQYMAKLLRIVQKYPIGIDAITVQTWLDQSKTRELAFIEAPWTKILFGETEKLMDPMLRQAEKATGLRPVGMPEERTFQAEDEDTAQ